MKLAVVALSLIAAWLAWTMPAYPHEWYEPACCSGRDCAPIPVDAVGFNSDGDYLVTIEGGSHPFVPETRTFTVPRSKARGSMDGGWHLCVGRAGVVYCLYEPRTY